MLIERVTRGMKGALGEFSLSFDFLFSNCFKALYVNVSEEVWEAENVANMQVERASLRRELRAS